MRMKKEWKHKLVPVKLKHISGNLQLRGVVNQSIKFEDLCTELKSLFKYLSWDEIELFVCFLERLRLREMSQFATSAPKAKNSQLSQFSSVQFSCSVVSDFLQHHGLQHARLPCPSLLELAQTHVHRVSDAIQPSHPLSSPSPPDFNLSQHHSLFQ